MKKQLIHDFIIAQSFYNPLLCFWVEIKNSCYWNCSNGLVPQIKVDPTSWQCPLINDLASASGGECPGGSVDACIDEACVPLENVIVYAACAKGCGKRCPNK